MISNCLKQAAELRIYIVIEHFLYRNTKFNNMRYSD